MSRRRALVLALAAAVLAAPGLARAQAAGEAVRSVRLDNGLTVLVRENPVAPVVAVALLVRMGSRWETAANAGISNFTHAVMVKGTTKRGGGDIAEAVAGMGGKISASGDVDYSGIQGTALARYWRELLEITAELALTPRMATASATGCSPACSAGATTPPPAPSTSSTRRCTVRIPTRCRTWARPPRWAASTTRRSWPGTAPTTGPSGWCCR
jgi:hypothetical protein